MIKFLDDKDNAYLLFLQIIIIILIYNFIDIRKINTIIKTIHIIFSVPLCNLMIVKKLLPF